MIILNKFAKTDFKSQDDFYKNFKIDVPSNFNFAYDVTDELALTQPDKTALVWVNDKNQERFFTFGELKTLSDKAANALKTSGINKGDVVMLMLKSNYQYWYITLALHKIGAVVVPATHQLTAKDITYRVDASDMKMIIASCDNRIIDSIEKSGAACKKALVNGSHEGYIDFDALIDSSSAQLDRIPNKATDIMLMYFTSGTTGMPKAVVHNFSYPLGHIITAYFWQDLRPSDLHYSFADTGWAKCSWGKIYGQWLCEAAVFVYDYDSKFQPTDMLEILQKYKITTFCAPPTNYRFLIKEDVKSYDLSSLRAGYIAGEPLNPEIYKQWQNLTGIKLREGFGQSEGPVLISTTKYIEPKPGSMGMPSPMFGIKLLDREGRECEVGEEGEICVDISTGLPTGLFTGYYNDKERTDSVMFGGYYRTGDIAWKDEDGYYWFMGRSDDVIKSSGYRIGPFEVESALLEHPAVLEAAITAVPDPIRGQIVKATVVLSKGFSPSEELKKELQEHVKNVTAPYKYPRIVEFVGELPKTISGKTRRKQIREEDENK